MIFSSALAKKVLSGEKVVTRRLTKNKPCNYKVGQDYAVQNKRGGKELGRILIVSVTHEQSALDCVSVLESAREGFTTPDGLSSMKGLESFWAYWDTLHGEGHRDEPVYRIEFELLEEEQ